MWDGGELDDSLTRYVKIVDSLSVAYDESASERDSRSRPAWKLDERNGFLVRLLAEGKSRLIEIGAGAGQDALFFKDHGIRVVAVDPSPKMIERCLARGLEAYVMDSLRLDFPDGNFDAGYAFNSLLHVPNSSLSDSLASISRVLAPEALLYIGQYGGREFEGVPSDDWHMPPRFFSFRTDSQLKEYAQLYFRLLQFRVVKVPVHFQALTLRVPGRSIADAK